MAAGLLEPLVVFWKEWGILVLVLLSFALQVILLITAEIRRRKDSGVLKVVVWSAYLLADTTAIYALGHMSVTSPTSHEHQLMAFWAPFLLLHLGGQDNITAYSMEDNRLWLRHLQNFFVQVLAAAYVLYQSSILARPTLLRPAAILMFVAGAVKYVERVCALKHSCSSHLSGKNYHSFSNVHYAEFHRHGIVRRKSVQAIRAVRAHILLDLSKYLLKEPIDRTEDKCFDGLSWASMYEAAEVQLSLMHDVFYSKAELIHTWHGVCIRVVSLPATVAALQLFRRFSEKDGYRKADVAATYVLLAGAVVLEIASVLRAMFSIWTFGKVGMSRVRARDPFSRKSAWVFRALTFLVLCPVLFRFYLLEKYSNMCRDREIPNTTRYWSGSMGQHNFIYMCSNCKYSRGSRIARWIGWEDWWNMLVYTSSVAVPAELGELLREQMRESEQVDTDSLDHIRNSRGRAALKRRPGLYEELRWSMDTELDESILVWHIATHVYLSWYEGKHTEACVPHHLAQVTKKLSNYMMFLLAERPYMLGDISSRKGYLRLCYWLIHAGCCHYSTEEDLLRIIRDHGDQLLRAGQTPQHAERDNDTYERSVTFDKACLLAAKLISRELETPDANMMKLISQVWVELLFYAANRCIPDSHARQLSNGGEFTTIVTLLLEYMKRGFVSTDSTGIGRKC
jgi:hypothetical protein